MNCPILMSEEFWMNSHLSMARFYGGIHYTTDGVPRYYIIVNKDGLTLHELSDPTNPHYVDGDKKAIPKGEPADLVLAEFVPAYRKLGRMRFLEILNKYPHATELDLLTIMNQ